MDIYLHNGIDEISAVFDNGNIIIKKGIEIQWEITTNNKVREQLENELHLLNMENKIKYKVKDEFYHIEILEDLTFFNPTSAAKFATGKKAEGWSRWIIKETEERLKTIKDNINIRKNIKRPITQTISRTNKIRTEIQKEIDHKQDEKIAELEKKIVNKTIQKGVMDIFKYKIKSKQVLFNITDSRALEKLEKLRRQKINISALIQHFLIEVEI